MVGVSAHERRHIERGGQAATAVAQDLFEPKVGVFRGAETSEHPHGPEARAIHRGMHTSGVGILPWVGGIAVDRVDGNTRHRLEIDVANLGRVVRFLPVLVRL